MNKSADISAYVAIDFETSGYYRHSACALGLARIENGLVTETWYTLIKPPSQRVCFTHIHGLTWDDLKDEAGFGEVWPIASQFIGKAGYLVAHNATFDRGVLYACCREFGFSRPPQRFLCTLKGSRKALNLPSRSLNNVCDYFGIKFTHHHAGADAQACAQVYANLRTLGLNDSDMMV